MWIKVSCLWGSPNLRVAFCADDSFKILWDYKINISSFAVLHVIASFCFQYFESIHNSYTFYLFYHLQNLFNQKMQAFAKPMLSKTSPTNVRGNGQDLTAMRRRGNIEKTDTFWDDHPTWSQLNQNEPKNSHIFWKNCFQIIKKIHPPKPSLKKPLSPTLHSPQNYKHLVLVVQSNETALGTAIEGSQKLPLQPHAIIGFGASSQTWNGLLSELHPENALVQPFSATQQWLKWFKQGEELRQQRQQGWVWRRIWVSWAQFDQKQYCKAQENWLEDTALIYLRHWQVPNSVKIQKCRLQQHLIILTL